MLVHPIPRWGIPSWDCTKRLSRLPMIYGLLHQGFVGGFLLLHFSECLCIFFELGLSWELIFSSITTFFSTVVAIDVVRISPGSLLLLFSVAFVFPNFTALCKHELVDDSVLLGISIIVIIRLIVLKEDLYCGHRTWVFCLVQHIVIFDTLLKVGKPGLV